MSRIHREFGLFIHYPARIPHGRHYINAHNIPKYFTLVDAPEGEPYPYRVAGYPFFNDQDGYPASRPPWGELLCLDLATAEYFWRKPLGEYDALSAKGIPPTGTFTVGGSICMREGLLFIGSRRDAKFRAFNSKNGETLWERQLESGAYATPCTYSVDGDSTAQSPRAAPARAAPGRVISSQRSHWAENRTPAASPPWPRFSPTGRAGTSRGERASPASGGWPVAFARGSVSAFLYLRYSCSSRNFA